MSNIIVTRLTSGEEILADVSYEKPEYIFKNPVRIAMMPGKDGIPNIGFAPFPTHAEPESEKTLKINESHIMYQYTPTQEYINNYNQIFGSGIVLPPTKQLITG